MKKYILVIDEGTTGVRACIFDRNMQLVGSEYEKIDLYYPEPGAVECDAEEIYYKTIRVCRNVIAKLKIDLDDIECAGITTQRTTWVCWNKVTGHPLRKAVVWYDTRGIHQKEKFLKDEEFNRLFPGLAERLPAGAHVLVIDRIKEQEPEFAEELGKTTTLWGNMDTWLIWKFTKGKVFATVSSMSCISGLYLLHDNAWDIPNKYMIEYMGMSVAAMPKVIDEADDFGYIDASLLGKEIPLYSNVADQQSALFGQGCLKENSIKCTSGTGTFIDINTGSELKSVEGLLTMAAWRFDGKMTYSLEGFSSTSGACLEWAKDKLRLFSDFDEMNSLAVQAEPSGGIFFAPGISGLIGYPYQDATARSAYMGISPNTTRKHFVRATLEGLAYTTADIIDNIKKSGIPLNEIKVSGGVSKSDFICQTISNVVKCDVIRPVSVESTAVGAAKFAALKAGWFNFEQSAQYLEIDKVFKPEETAVDYDKEFKRWKDVVRRTLKWEL